MQNVFKLYDGRTGFYQWDTGQRLIVLNDDVTEVHFSNRDMTHSTRVQVYETIDGTRVCDVPDVLLQLPRNLVAYAYTSDGVTSSVIKSVKFAVMQRPIPDDYVIKKDEQITKVNDRLEILENTLKDIDLGKKEMNKFDSVVDAAIWAKESKACGSIVVIHIDGKWIAHIVEDDYSLSPICDHNGDLVEVNIFDGGDADGFDDNEHKDVRVWDGGGAAGV